MKCCLLLIACVAVLSRVWAASVEPMARVEAGAIRGTKMTSTSGRQFLAFRGIRYAQAPVGSLRFQDPLPVLPWDGVFDAIEDGPACVQLEGVDGPIRGTEDCLRLNVYTHSTNSEDKPRPVMVYVHGGGWSSGSGYGDTDVYGPNNYMDRDIVLVTINYRLHALGFLSTEDDVAPGNYGLLDQTMALRWVQENIEKFGGDPQRVTLFGQSSGAGSVHSHVLSPRSKGLFQRAIAQSGTALCPWCIQRYVGNYTQMLAKHLKCPTEPSAALVECLRTKDARDIIEFRKITQVADTVPVAFGPRIDRERKEPFFPTSPEKIIRSGSFNHVPFIVGVNANEGAYAVARLAGKGRDQIDAFRKSPETLVKYMLGIEFESDASAKSLSVYRSYFGNRTDVSLTELEQLVSDGVFFKCADDTIKLHRQFGQAPLYAYLYNHRGLFTFPMLYLTDDNQVEFGVSHGDEVLLQFAVPFLPPLILPSDIKTQQILSDLWTSFADSGVPTERTRSFKWDPVKPNQMEYLKINDGSAIFVEGEYPFVDRLSRWEPVNKSLN